MHPFLHLCILCRHVLHHDIQDVFHASLWVEAAVSIYETRVEEFVLVFLIQMIHRQFDNFLDILLINTFKIQLSKISLAIYILKF